MGDLALGQHFHVAIISSSQVAVPLQKGPRAQGHCVLGLTHLPWL